MPILNPPHPGGIIKDSIIAVGLTLTEAAAHLDVSEPWLAAVLAGQAAITAELAVRLELAGWSKAPFWLRLQTAYDLRQAQRREGDFRVRRFPKPSRIRSEINELATAMHDSGALDTATFQRITRSRDKPKSVT